MLLASLLMLCRFGLEMTFCHQTQRKVRCYRLSDLFCQITLEIQQSLLFRDMCSNQVGTQFNGCSQPDFDIA